MFYEYFTQCFITTFIKRFDILARRFDMYNYHEFTASLLDIFIFWERNPFRSMSRALIDRMSKGRVRSRNDEEDSENSDRVKRRDKDVKRKKISFQDRGNVMHSSRYLPMTQKSEILKDRRICVQKTGGFTRCGTLLRLPLSNFLGWIASSPVFFSPRYPTIYKNPVNMQDMHHPHFSICALSSHVCVYVCDPPSGDLPKSRENLPAPRYTFATTL